MISPEAFRAVVGLWQCRICPTKCAKKTEPGSSRMRQINKYLKLLRLALLTLSVVWTSTELSLRRSILSNSEEGPCETMSLRMIMLLLVMSGLETNPGPNKEGKICEHCGRIFNHSSNLQRHIRRWHTTKHLVICRFCNRPFESRDEWEKHMEDLHKPRTRRWQVSNHAFQKRVLELTLLYQNDKLETALGEQMKKEVFSQIRYYLRFHGTIRFKFVFYCLMRHENIDGTVLDTFYFQNRPVNLVRGEGGLKKLISDEFELLRNQVLALEVENQVGSGWTFECSEAFMISLTKLSNKTMGSYMNFEPRNEKGNVLKGFKKYTVNVKNSDNKCSIYNIILSKFGCNISGDPSNPKNLEPFMRLVDDTDVEYPTSEKDLLCLERNNKDTLNIAINVWRYVDCQRIEPYYISKIRRRGRTECNMLLIEETGQGDEPAHRHLIHIKDISSFFRNSCGLGQQRRHTYCPSCFHFKTESYTKMMSHWKVCTDSNYFKKKYPEAKREFLPDGNVIPTPNSYKSERPYLRGFFDFETLHSPQENACTQCVTKLKKLGFSGTFEVECAHTNEQKTIRLTELPAICFSLLILDEQGEIVYEKYYQGSDAAAYFSEHLYSIQDQMMEIIDKNTKMIMTKEDRAKFNAATQCEECGKLFDDKTPKCRDHHHLSGKFRGTLCNFCNLQKKSLRFIPLYAHNFSGFDSHLIMRSLDMDENDFSTLSRNSEKIITMSLGKFKLIDSSSFMPESLENLVSNLLDKGKKHFKQTQRLSHNSKSKFRLLTRKGVFPYEYLDNVSKLKERSLPQQVEFYSKLKETAVDNTEYLFAQRVWKTFKCKTIGGYMKHYCRLDVRLLADVWTDWAATASEHFKIEAEAGFISLPSFAFDCFLSKTFSDEQVLITLIDKNLIPLHDDITRGIRGGSCIIKQKAAFDTAMETALMSYANTEELAEYERIMEKYGQEDRRRSEKLVKKGISTKKCDQVGCGKMVPMTAKKCRRHATRTILALDFTNLYGYSMTHKMPLDSFRTVEQSELDTHQTYFDSNKTQKMYSEASNQGFIFTAQLDFPKKVQKKLLSYPLVPEALLVEEEMLSKGQKATWKALFSKKYSNGGHKKMINSFKTKKNYTSHYQLLSYLSSLGVKVTLVRGYAFRQKEFIAGYANFCASQRKKSSNAADKKLWKNMINIMYGKCIGNLNLSHPI